MTEERKGLFLSAAMEAEPDRGAPAPERGILRQSWFLHKTAGWVKERSLAAGRPLTACSVCFGCQMNARDSEKIAGVLKMAGFELTEEENADFVIYNTCTVRDNADSRVYGRLGRVSHFRRANPDMRVALCGCMMQEKSAVEKVRKSYGFVDLIFGTHNLDRFPEYLYRTVTGTEKITEIEEEDGEGAESLPIARKYPWKSGVNIMFGCDNFCTYCIVPYVRGRERSRMPEEILDEIRRLRDDGVREIMLLGQNVDSYGKKTETGASFAELLSRAADIDGIERVRFMTSHPKDLSPEVIRVVAGNEKIARHIHLPLQSGSNRILKMMNRRYTREHYLELVQAIREGIPGVAITTDIMTGFPSETPEDIDDTIDVVRKAAFENAFTFIYSMRAGTPASRMEQLPEEEKKAGFTRVLSVVQEVAKEQTLRSVGLDGTALIEELNGQIPGYVTGRLSNNTLVHIPGTEEMIGRFVRVHLDECRGFYYFGTAVGEPY